MHPGDCPADSRSGRDSLGVSCMPVETARPQQVWSGAQA